ncbi:MAG: hypothetical protein PHI68_06865 [Candidatus Cloacimonetes bacterium]|nr:hypothetical protein [Candidatus Cloacimonadota bacterium]
MKIKTILILAPVVLALIVLTIVIIITMFQSEEPELVYEQLAVQETPQTSKPNHQALNYNQGIEPGYPITH